MDVVLFSAGFVVAFWLLTVLPISVCLNAARAREADPLVGLFVGLLLSWVGVVVFVSVLTFRDRVARRQRRAT